MIAPTKRRRELFTAEGAEGAEYRADLKGIISHRLSLEDVRGGYELFARKADDCRKIVMYPHGLREANA